MSNLYLVFTAPSGGSFAATIERLSDNFFREDDAEIFSSGLVFSDKNITLTEQLSPNLGSYTNTLDSSTWNDGQYLTRIHDSSENNTTIAANRFSIKNGEQVQIGDESSAENIYFAKLKYTRDETNSQDEFTATFYRNDQIISSGIGGAGLTLLKRSNGTALFTAGFTQVGTAARYKYNTTDSGQRLTAGEAYFYIASGTIDGTLRVFDEIVGRDATS